METKQQVTKKFIVGAVIIILSFVLGKLVLIPFFIFPGDESWAVAMFWVYIASWVMLFIGILIAGVEGYKLTMYRYYDIKYRSIEKVKTGGRKVGEKSRIAARKVKEKSTNAALKVGQHSVKAARKVKEKSKEAAQKIKKLGR